MLTRHYPRHRRAAPPRRASGRGRRALPLSRTKRLCARPLVFGGEEKAVVGLGPLQPARPCAGYEGEARQPPSRFPIGRGAGRWKMALLGSPLRTLRALLRELRLASGGAGRPYRDTPAYRHILAAFRAHRVRVPGSPPPLSFPPASLEEVRQRRPSAQGGRGLSREVKSRGLFPPLDRSPARSCAGPSRSCTSRLPPTFACSAASENTRPCTRSTTARGSAPLRRSLAWWASGCLSSREGKDEDDSVVLSL